MNPAMLALRETLVGLAAPRAPLAALTRICAEIREELTPEPADLATALAAAPAAAPDGASRIRGAVYVSICTAIPAC
jgi:hypothetical protein